MGPSEEEVLHWFDAVRLDERDTHTLQSIRNGFKTAAADLMRIIPPSANRTTALRELHRASQAAVFAFTHHQETNHA